jgi:hypothetical protein
MTVTQNIFLAWGLFCGGAALILASPTLAVIRYANKVAGDRRPELLSREKQARCGISSARSYCKPTP